MAVTGGLAVAGADVGAGLGAAVVGVWGLVVAGPRELWDNPMAFGFAALVGAVVGSVLAPPVAWLLLRRVPLGRAILETALGTALGATVGLILSGFHPYYGLAGARAEAADPGQYYIRRRPKRLGPRQSAHLGKNR